MISLEELLDDEGGPCTKASNPSNGSCGIVRTFLSQEMKYPPTAVGRIVDFLLKPMRVGRVVRLVPNAPLTANTLYFFTINTNIRDLDGTAQTFVFQRSITTGTIADNTKPQVLLVSPPDAAIGVGVNANIRVQFDDNNREVLIVTQAPLPESTVMTLKVEGVEDLAGNLVTPQTTQFTTGTGADLTNARVIRTNPFNGAASVPVNSLITVEVNEPIDAGTINNNTFIVRDNTTFQGIAGTLSVSADGRLITFMPNAPLLAIRNYSVFFSFQGIRDLAGNFLEGTNFSFTTSAVADSIPPQVLIITPANGFTDVPTNGAVMIQFNEPIQSLSIDQVTLSAGGVNVSVNRTLSNSNQTLTLKPLAPLAGLTTYNLSVGGVKDLSGNALTTAVTSSFTTAAGVDLVNPTVTQADPAHGATGVATNAVVKLQFSERINPLTVTDSTFFVGNATTEVRVNGSLTISADGRSITFTPSDPLLVNTRYFIQVSNITDLTGHPASFFSIFNTGPQ